MIDELNINALKAANLALTQLLDDGQYITDYDKEEWPIFDYNKTGGGCYCHAAALMAMKTLALVRGALLAQGIDL